jgi:triphosphoribosyl-dephospho-CoA synthetase
MMKNLKKTDNQREEKTSPAKWKKIRERAGELAMNQGKRSDEVGEEEMQRAKRELLEMKITSPKGGQD